MHIGRPIERAEVTSQSMESPIRLSLADYLPEELPDVCRPLGIEVYALDEGLLKDFKPPAVAAYKGAHGLRLPKAAWER